MFPALSLSSITVYPLLFIAEVKCFSPSIDGRSGFGTGTTPRSVRREGPRDPASVQCKRENDIQRNKLHTSSFNKLPDVLVVEILSRLPLKSFFCCKSVCKTWLSLFYDAACLNKHLQPTMSGFFYNQGYGANSVKLSCGINKVEVDGMISTFSFQDRLNILDCCNGLLLVEAYPKKSDVAYDVHVYNPATWTLFTLWSHKPHDQAFSLAFDPQVSHMFHVIKFTDGFNDKGNFINILSFERGKCKHRKWLVSDVRINQYCKGNFLDGRVNRLTTQDEILSIDLNNCSYEVIRPPNLENRALIEIGQSRGVLHCMSICHEKMFFIWVLESYTRQEWTLKYQLSLDAIYSVPIRSVPIGNLGDFCINRIKHSRHFAFHPEKDVIFMPVGNKSFVSLDLSTGKGDKLDSLGNNREGHCWVYTPCYLL